MPSRPRLRPTAVVAASLLAPVEGVDSAKRKNRIIFENEMSQRIAERITYLKVREGERRNCARLEPPVLRTCVGNVDSCTERGPVIVQGHTKGNTFKHYGDVRRSYGVAKPHYLSPCEFFLV